MNYSLELAMDYLHAGFSIIPLRPYTKDPMLTRWKEFQQCLPTEQQLTWWFKLPDVGIALLTGQLSGCIALDIDSPDAERYVLEHGALPFTPTNKTRRGKHVLFAHPGFKVGNHRHIADGLDIRGDGGYVAVYPSVHPSGYRYIWQISPQETPFEPLPDWLRVALQEKPNRPTANAVAQSFAAGAIGNQSAYGTGALRCEAFEVSICKVDRNNRLYRAALKLGSLIRDGQLNRDQAERALLDASWACGLSADDGETASFRTIASGINKGMESSRASYRK